MEFRNDAEPIWRELRGRMAPSDEEPIEIVLPPINKKLSPEESEKLLDALEKNYSRNIAVLTERWADTMEDMLAHGEDPSTIPECSLEMVSGSSTGFQVHQAAQYLISLWEHGQIMHRWYTETRGLTYEPYQFDPPEGATILVEDDYSAETPTSTDEEFVFVDGHMLIDPNAKQMTDQFEKLALNVKKRSKVTARQAEVQEVIVTMLSGNKEVENTAYPGDWIVTNPGGERYVLTQEGFGAKYVEDPDNEGQFVSVAEKLVIPNPTVYPLAIPSPWEDGKIMKGDQLCFLACVAKWEGNKLTPTFDRYIIGRSELNITHDTLLSTHAFPRIGGGMSGFVLQEI